MMFDPPDYPFKELSETYDDLLLSKNSAALPDAVDETVIGAPNNESFHSNDTGRYFKVDGTYLEENCTNDLGQNTGMCVVQPENMLSYEPTLLDEKTVNQFLLPLQDVQSNEKNEDNSGPDLLSLHSCVICHDIFTTEADLLDHTIAFHASLNITELDEFNDAPFGQADSLVSEGTSKDNADFDTDWLVCRICERVLSTALEEEPKEQLCCVDENGRFSASTRKLQTMFVCDLCSGLFADGDALDKHRIACYVEESNLYDKTDINSNEVASSYPEVYYSCDICGNQCSSTEELKTHLLQCHKPIARNCRKTRAYTGASNSKMWNCGSCNQLFATARELYRHKRGEDRPEGSPLMAYVCEECDKVLGSMCALHTHKKMHKVSKPGYPCCICGRRFNQSGHLAIHMRMHTGERPYPCDLCPKAFKVKVERDDHRRTHTGERPFACTACPKTFTAAARLREHARIHTDQRPYQCHICGAAFRRPYARTVHTLIHTGEKPHECDICGTAFRRSGDMWKHKRTLHGT